MQMREHLKLPGSLDYNNRSMQCGKCGLIKFLSDGVESNGKFVCGTCWRKRGSTAKKFGVKK